MRDPVLFRSVDLTRSLLTRARDIIQNTRNTYGISVHAPSIILYMYITFSLCDTVLKVISLLLPK